MAEVRLISVLRLLSAVSGFYSVFLLAGTRSLFLLTRDSEHRFKFSLGGLAVAVPERLCTMRMVTPMTGAGTKRDR